MSRKYTNNANLPLPFAVLLATDTYDMVPAKEGEKKISVTTLLRSPRQVILSQRAEGQEGNLTDLSDLVSSGVGSAIHYGFEQAWQAPQEAMRALGYPEHVVNRVKVNPETWTKDDLPVWTELRTEKEFMGYTISGCADMILDGKVVDLKTTGIFAWTSGNNDKKYRLQLSFYRWLNQDKVTRSVGYIEFFFRDWKKLEASYNPNYPQQPMLEKEIPLMSVQEVENYARNKITVLEQYWDKPEPELPYCTADDLWQDKPKYQYFGKVDAQKASKNFNTEAEANAWLAQKGKGVVRFKPGKAKACNYCAAKFLCSQARKLTEQGLL